MARRFMPVASGARVTSGFGPRWGTMHMGTDFGRENGSGGDPIYAAQGGIVKYAGAARGFGGPDPCGWIVLDHSDADGSGATVYGHIIREVSVDQRVEAGQRIGRINPVKGPGNGNVDPHLHFEVCPYEYKAGAQIDPIPWLEGAEWPDVHIDSNTTRFGLDVSSHQNGISLRQAKEEGMDFVIIRLCDGTYRDPLFGSHLQDAEQAGLQVSTYWYLRAPSEGSTFKQQVDVIDSQFNGRKDLGVWIDVESVRGQKKLLTGADVWEAKRELESRGYYVPGIYSAPWYWEGMPGGEPSMEGLGFLWKADYGTNPQGYYRNIYPGNGSRKWSYPLGDRAPDIWQYGSRGLVAGFAVDVNAYRGDLEQLHQMFYNKPRSGVVEQKSLLEELMTERIPSLINPSKNFDAATLLALVDKATWENRVLLKELFKLLGRDADAILEEAIAKDNEVK